MSRTIRNIIITLGLAALIALTFVVAVESAQAYEGVSVKHARQHVKQAKAELRDAERVLTATRHYTAAYGASVGRWVWLSDDVGWPPAQWPTLFYVIDRESGGNPHAQNPTSSASGLLQFLSSWWYGKWDPMDPYQNLRHGYLAWRQVGWQPWSLTAY